jgi:ABC-type uncharacterized transport system permease subunit
MLVARGLHAGRFPTNDSFEMLAFFVGCGALLYLVASRLAELPSLTAFAMPIAAVFMAGAAAIAPEAVEPVAPRTVWVAVHATLALLGTAGFAAACVLAVMYLLQDRQLKLHAFGRLLERLPSLEELDRLAYRALALGFTLFTAALFVGTTLIYDPRRVFGQSEGRAWLSLSVVAWLTYAVVLHVRRRARLRGRKVAYLTILGFVLAAAAFGGILFGVHRF